MGVCSSCLGLGRRNNQGDESETRRLLYDDPYRGGRYGATRNAPHQDPESVRRERETLAGIVQVMSDNVIDVFSSIPQPQSQPGLHPQMQVPYSAQGLNGGYHANSLHQPETLYGPLTDTEDLSPADLSVKTIKKGRAGPVFTGLGKEGVLGFKAVQDAIG